MKWQLAVQKMSPRIFESIAAAIHEAFTSPRISLFFFRPITGLVDSQPAVPAIGASCTAATGYRGSRLISGLIAHEAAPAAWPCMSPSIQRPIASFPTSLHLHLLCWIRQLH